MHYFGTIETSENGDIIGIGDYHVKELSKEAQMFVGGMNEIRNWLKDEYTEAYEMSQDEDTTLTERLDYEKEAEVLEDKILQIEAMIIDTIISFGDDEVVIDDEE